VATTVAENENAKKPQNNILKRLQERIAMITNKIKITASHLFDHYVNIPFQRQHVSLLEQEIIGSCQTLLDIGCGSGNHIRGCPPHLIKKAVGIDAFPEAVAKAKESGLYTETILARVDQLANLFEESSFECVVAFDLIEHLEKAEGLSLIAVMEKLSSKKVIIFTPNGFLPQDSIQGNPYQVHRSGWSASEMKFLGYTVYGVHGFKGILGEESLPKWRPYMFWKLVTVLFQPLFLKMPKLAFQIFCVKVKK
jgi:SAM-dependent methyltransferase